MFIKFWRIEGNLEQTLAGKSGSLVSSELSSHLRFSVVLEKSCSIPNVLLFIPSGLWSTSHTAFVSHRTCQVVHIRHLADLSYRCGTNELILLLLLAHRTAVLLVLSVFILPLCLFFTVQHCKFFLELTVLHAELSPNRDESAETVNVVLVFRINFLVDFEGLVEQVHPSVTGGDHQLPLHLFWLDLRRALEVLNGFLEHILLCVVHT